MQLLPPPLARHRAMPLAPLYLLLPPLLLTEAGVTSGPRLQWRSVITAPSFPRSQPADCAGSLKSFQVGGDLRGNSIKLTPKFYRDSCKLHATAGPIFY